MKNASLIFAALISCAACNGKNSYDKSAAPRTDESPNQVYANTITENKEQVSGNLNEESTLSLNGTGITTSGDKNKEAAFLKKSEEDRSWAVKATAKQLIQTADIKFQVEDINRSAAAIEELIAKYDASVSTSNMETSYNNTETRMSVRVTPARFNLLIGDLMKQSIYVNYKNIRSEDVTAEYVDIETRLKTKREVEARYIDILKNKAKTVDDVLHAENEIRVIHEEIEAKVGRLNYLKDQVAFSTINLEFYQVTKVTGQPDRIEYSYWGEAGDAFSMGWSGVKRFFIALISIWPLYFIGFAGYLVVRRVLVKKKAKTSV